MSIAKECIVELLGQLFKSQPCCETHYFCIKTSCTLKSHLGLISSQLITWMQGSIVICL